MGYPTGLPRREGVRSTALSVIVRGVDYHAKPMKTLYLIGNWKQHGSQAAIEAFSGQWSSDQNSRLCIAIAPPFPYLRAMAEALAGCDLAAQDCSVHAQGAHTGEVSADCLLYTSDAADE